MYMYMHIHVRDAYTTETWLPIIHAGHKLCSSSPQVSLQIYYRYLQEPIMKEGRGGGKEHEVKSQTLPMLHVSLQIAKPRGMYVVKKE